MYEMSLKMTDLFIEELKHEAAGTRKTLERVPEGRNDWKPHEKSMPLGYLASLVAAMPRWIGSMIELDELDFAPVGENANKPLEWKTQEELLAGFDANVEKALTALAGTTDEHLLTNWKLKAGGYEVSNLPRHWNIRTGVINHWAHHRGQLTVYLRLNDALVPALYGPSADDRGF
jgi:uncharacterized damage-inducible protein DinB